MTALAVAALLLAAPAGGQDGLGGHAPREEAPGGVPVPADRRRAVLEEMWQRRLLAPDQRSWSPQDLELLGRIQRAEPEARKHLRRRHGGDRPWVAGGRAGAPERLTKEGYDLYRAELTQEALDYFEGKGTDAKWGFQLRDMDGKPLFDPRGQITEEGARVYRRARLNLPVFWRAPNGEVMGTRRPPAPGAEGAVPSKTP